jgi:hypothetical protein
MTLNSKETRSAPRGVHPSLLPATRAVLTGQDRSSFNTVMKHGRGMGESGANSGHTEARAMLDVFVSVGAARFDVTWTNAAGDKERFRRNVSPAELTRTLPEILGDAIRRQRNLIVRPYGPSVSFIQLDDLKADKPPPLAPAVFLTIETSPGNFQA